MTYNRSPQACNCCKEVQETARRKEEALCVVLYLHQQYRIPHRTKCCNPGNAGMAEYDKRHDCIRTTHPCTRSYIPSPAA
eukprot:11590258-Ditylum_brightwellii.AAC.1